MSAAPESYDAIVLGAGGAGLMYAAVAGQRGRRVLLIDHGTAALLSPRYPEPKALLTI